MDLSKKQVQFLQALTHLAVYIIKVDQEVAPEEMEMLQEQLVQLFPNTDIQQYIKDQIIVDLIHSAGIDGTMDILLRDIKTVAEKIVLVHFILNFIGADNRYRNSEMLALYAIERRLGFSEDEKHMVNIIYFRCIDHKDNIEEVIKTLTLSNSALQEAYKELLSEFHFDRKILFGDEPYYFFEPKLLKIS